MSLTHKGHGVYLDDRTDNLFHRPTINGRRTWRKLDSTTFTQARREVSVLKTRQLEARIGVALDPYAKLISIAQLAKEWVECGCPDRRGVSRAGDSLKYEKARLDRLLPFWGRREARSANAEDCRDYHSWRVRLNKKKFRLGRSVDSELTCLSNLLWWASQHTRKTGLTQNPLIIKPRFDDTKLTRHCTAVMPESDEQMHAIAGFLLGSERSRPLGWQMLLESLTGARTSEILACRMDATKPREAGYQDETALHLHRLKKGIEPWALLEVVKGHAPLKEMLLAFRHWHKKAYPKNQWFIPGMLPSEPADRCSLTHALRRACEFLNVPIITSHGLRAYFVRTLRSLGVDDSEIAKRLGHRSGVELVEKTYGISEPGWFGAKRMDFLPKDIKPAWSAWLPPHTIRIPNRIKNNKK
jgi:integrase